MRNRTKLITLLIIAILLIVVFLFTDLGSNLDYVLPKRTMKIIAIILTGSAIAFSTVVFQTITNNRILTPSIIGLDSLYLLIQTFIIFVFGSTHMTLMNQHVNFVISVGLMIVFALLLYHFLFKKEDQNIYFLLLIGLIFGTFFNSLSDFMQVLIDPNEFLVVQDRMFASFNNVNTELLLIAFVGIVLATLYFLKFTKYLDVLSLGKEHAINLGVDYDRVVKQLFVVIAILISIATVLVGPITFLGLLVANVAYQFLKTYRHSVLILGAILISIIALVSGQLIVERVFTFSTTISVIINFVGGVYFIYLLLKESRV
ncbi:iron chelate uptake ABC transporter family permease subunit [Tenuibacillus multivorans]|uniref:Iron complex transport system permease protein n=1 Tax=Tenuibacillus multivorans TaxID=237069 RepID=A0A1H0AZ25_9BACI|nr:iron chelate uptake ABC transporter family permease subunit [Tenuibacillus multivorans]GEL77612.1 putative ABC transporter permease protein YclO [Tenuibacillus multivorans]SDN38476.1 iron complex transport system permease protein [Tenuibacillus multivorans]